ncbi:cobalamin biosynthetic protein [Pseudomonas syringae pv. syringae]|nr:cobalamin biosynthetic protein [Pseudomonas syringae pv. syringae]
MGTSEAVYPAAELPLRALGDGAPVVHINSVQFDISSQEYFLEGVASQMMQSSHRKAFGGPPVS